MEMTIAALIFLSVTTFASALHNKLQPAKIDLHGRLKHVISVEEPIDSRQAELSRPLTERLLLPLFGMLSVLATRLLPKDMLKSLEKKVLQSGRATRLTARDYLGMKVAFSLGLLAFVYLTHYGAWDVKSMGLAGMATLIGWRFPDMKLDRSVRSRKEILEKTFPDTLDLLTVSVEAGLGFDGAIAKVVEKSRGPVAEDFRRVLHEIKMGKPRKEALRDFGERSGIDDIKSFTGAIIQADQLGLNIGNTLKNQSDQMRRKRRQRVEEKAMKVPVKMLIPLVVFIFPTIFIVLLGPAVIQILENFTVM